MGRFENFTSNNYLIKLAETPEEYSQVFKLRYQDLVLKYDGNKENKDEIDKDEYDKVCDHLIAVDNTNNKVVGTYRLIKKSHLTTLKTFLTETEFNLDILKKYELLEVGRAVVHNSYRDGVVIGLLWSGVIRYALSEHIEIMIGTASFQGINPFSYQEELSYLYDYHLSPKELRCPVNGKSSVPLKMTSNYDPIICKKKMPPLIKGYINLGATIGDGAYIDKDFNSVDVLIVLVIKDINPRYLKRYL